MTHKVATILTIFIVLVLFICSIVFGFEPTLILLIQAIGLIAISIVIIIGSCLVYDLYLALFYDDEE